ncbi:MAG: hypothetical protein ACO3UU_11910 [Minisyncoccia bacterium]
MESKVNAGSDISIEEERARIFLGISISDYSKLVGGTMWSHLTDFYYGNITCKADVIVLYQLINKQDSLIEKKMMGGK